MDSTYFEISAEPITAAPNGTYNLSKIRIKVKQTKDDAIVSGHVWLQFVQNVASCGYLMNTQNGTKCDNVLVPFPDTNSIVWFGYYRARYPCGPEEPCQFQIYAQYLPPEGSNNAPCSTTFSVSYIRRLTEMTLSCQRDTSGNLSCTVRVDDVHPGGSKQFVAGLINVNDLWSFPYLNNDLTVNLGKTPIPYAVTAEYVPTEGAAWGVHYGCLGSWADGSLGSAGVKNVSQIIINEEAVCHRLQLASTILQHTGSIVCATVGSPPIVGNFLNAVCTCIVEGVALGLDLTICEHCDDHDGDGLSDWVEMQIKTNKLASDSDGDGLSDAQEIDFAGGKIDTTFAACDPSLSSTCVCPNPKLKDSDGDGLDDGDEFFVYQTSFCRTDTDGDGVSDSDEIETWSGGPLEQANPLQKDTDGDGLSDADEWPFANSGPRDGYVNSADSDGDGVPDAEDVWKGHENEGDVDGDGKYPIVDPDSDNDGLTDGEERALGTDWLKWDTDDDGLSDSEELRTHATDPLNRDSDGDRLWDGAEVERVCSGKDPQLILDPEQDGDDNYTITYVEAGEHLDPRNPDSDMDGHPDGTDDDPCCSPLIPIITTDDETDEREPVGPRGVTGRARTVLLADLDRDRQIDDSLWMEDSDGDRLADVINVDFGHNGFVDVVIQVHPNQCTGVSEGETKYVVTYSVSDPGPVFVATVFDDKSDLVPDRIDVVSNPTLDSDEDGVPDTIEVLIGADPNDADGAPLLIRGDFEHEGRGEDDDAVWISSPRCRGSSECRALVIIDIGKETSFVGERAGFGESDEDYNEDEVTDHVFALYYDHPLSVCSCEDRRVVVFLYDYGSDGTIDATKSYCECRGS